VRNQIKRFLAIGGLAAGMSLMAASASAQAPARREPVAAPPVVTIEQPDAQRTRDELARLLEHYPPTLRGILALDPTLLGNQVYLAPYPGLVSFLNQHPEIARNPAFYIGEAIHSRPDAEAQIIDMWKDILGALGVFVGVAMAIALLVWLIRTLIDYRRWSRLAKVQTDVHTKLLDRFTANEDLIAYIQSPAGSKFLESSPIKLDAGPKTLGAPIARILWSVQGGLVLIAAGIGLEIVGRHASEHAAEPLQALGVLAIALGIGFVISAIISYVISQRLGLIEPPSAASRTESPGV